jgi:zinc-binding alcohol dehydrogenase family protein
VDYSGDVPAAVREGHPDGVDGLIVAAFVGEGFEPLTELVRDGADVDGLAGRRIASSNVVGQSDPQKFAGALQLAAEGSLAVPITETYGFDELPEALGLAGKRHTRGKSAIRIA